MFCKLPRRAAVLLTTVGLLFSASVSSTAADLFVPSVFPTIQSALDAAAPGDQILVDPGTYSGSLNFNQKDVTVRSVQGAESTILLNTVSSPNPTVRIGPAGAIIGFTIRKPSPGMLGGAIIAQGAGSYIASNIIENHRDGLGTNGAAIGMNNASPVVERNIFRNNSSTPSGIAGVISLINGSSPYIANNIFHNNSGRAINVTVPVTARPVVVNNTIVNNLAGIRVDTRIAAAAQIYRNNILVGNGTGFQTEFGGVANNPTWQNNLVSGNTTNYSGTSDLTGTAGNISADPLFEDAAARNYRLQAASPAIDAGSNLIMPQIVLPMPLLDFDMTPRIADGNGDGVEIADIGAFEYTGVVIGSIELTVDGGEVQECLSPQGNTVEARIAVTPENLELASIELLLNGASVAKTLVSQITLPMGTNLIEAVVVTGAGHELRSQRSVQVVDTTAPVINARFVDRRSGRELSSVERNGMTFVSVKIDADDVCDPKPEVESMLGTEIMDGAGLGIIGQANQLRLETDKITLKVMATDASGNVSVETKHLSIHGKPDK